MFTTHYHFIAECPTGTTDTRKLHSKCIGLIWPLLCLLNLKSLYKWNKFRGFLNYELNNFMTLRGTFKVCGAYFLAATTMSSGMGSPSTDNNSTDSVSPAVAGGAAGGAICAVLILLCIDVILFWIWLIWGK